MSCSMLRSSLKMMGDHHFLNALVQLSATQFSSIKSKKHAPKGSCFLLFGGDEGGRTPYLLNAIQALYQLSYTPKARCILYHLSSVVNRLAKKQREYYG